MKPINWFDNVENRPHPHPGLTWLTPMLYVNDVQKALNFYQEVFGFVPIFELPEETGNIGFARLRYRGCNFTLTQEGLFDYEGRDPSSSGYIPPFMFYIYVDNVDDIVQKCRDQGGKVLQEPRMEFWGDQKARLCDSFGYIWEIATRVN